MQAKDVPIGKVFTYADIEDDGEAGSTIMILDGFTIICRLGQQW